MTLVNVTKMELDRRERERQEREHGYRPNGAGPHGLSTGEFLSEFAPPDYTVDGLLQRGFLYSLTAATGAGKTSCVLTLAGSVSSGRQFGNAATTQGDVLMLVGENPDDVRMRVIGMQSQNLPFLGDRLTWEPRRFDIEAEFERLKTEAIARRREYAFVSVETSMAYWHEAGEENDNPSAYAHARKLRRLTELPGHPTVLVSCHPAGKGVEAKELMVPRGASAMLNEVDGNLCLTMKDGDIRELHWTGKIRGPDFEPIPFQIQRVETAKLVDSRGRMIPTVVARGLTSEEEEAGYVQARREEDRVLAAMAMNSGASIADIARDAGFVSHGEPQKSKVHRMLQALAKDKLVEKHRQTYRLTGSGKEKTNGSKGLSGNGQAWPFQDH